MHIFRLTQYSKIIFLDADVLPIRPLSHLFALPHEFSAAPDVGWPDIFNSGVLVFSPGEDKFTELNELLKSKGTWDGGDQGILNEWRGGNWNRLSFTYNTTPTAAYTSVSLLSDHDYATDFLYLYSSYAPAYERYGSQISAIHFIGPNKPWNSIAYRPPFTNYSSDSTTGQAYDYDSLVNRWFAVYDKHCRSEAVAPATQFEVQKYVSAWDEPRGTSAEAMGAGNMPSGGALGLDDLKRLAVEGMSAARSSAYDSGEGIYTSLPLEGRVDLMWRPQEEDTESAQLEGLATPVQRRIQLGSSDETPRWETLPTPGPNEVPPSPKMHPVSLPYTPTAPQHHHHRSPSHSPSPDHQQQSQQSSNPGAQQQEHHQEQHQHHEHHEHQPQHDHQHQDGHKPQHEHHHHQQHHEEPPRPRSPPMLLWNPAIEPPPNVAPTPSAFPADTYFPNIWDQAPSKEHDQAYQQEGQETTTDDRGFFQPPPPPEIPEPLRREGHYRKVTGEDEAGATPSPDRTKVKSVFPWEEKPRHMPGRVFPVHDAPSREMFITPETTPPALTISTPELSPRQPILSPLRGLPKTLTYANAWDTVPSIQKYASKLVRPLQPPPVLAPAFDSDGWRRRGGEPYRSWEDKTDASSQDGDDEDEGDDEDDEPALPSNNSGDDEDLQMPSRSPPKPRSRSGSAVSSSYIIKGKKKEYRVRGVQTINPEMRSQGIQVNVPPKVLPRPDIPKKPARKGSISDRRQSRATDSLAPLPAATVGELSIGPDLSMTTAMPSPAEQPDVHSPREFIFPTSSPKALPIQGQLSTPSPKSIVKPTIHTTPPNASSRKLSNESSSVASPPSSVGPLSPPDGQPISPVRKGGRVWDPARGVELFKRGSEEVLARFLKMGSWEENAR